MAAVELVFVAARPRSLQSFRAWEFGRGLHEPPTRVRPAGGVARVRDMRVAAGPPAGLARSSRRVQHPDRPTARYAATGSLATASLAGSGSGSRAASICRAIVSIVWAYARIASSAPSSPQPAM